MSESKRISRSFGITNKAKRSRKSIRSSCLRMWPHTRRVSTLFDTLRLDIHLSEPDYNIGLDKERISDLRGIARGRAASRCGKLRPTRWATSKPIITHQPTRASAHRACFRGRQGRTRADRILWETCCQSARATPLDGCRSLGRRHLSKQPSGPRRTFPSAIDPTVSSTVVRDQESHLVPSRRYLPR